MFTDMKPLLQVIEASDKNYNLEKIRNAYLYAKNLHEGQMRQSGEPYISHPVAVASIVAELGLDTDSICAALLHDTVEDCADKTNLETLSKMFGEELDALGTYWLEKLPNVSFDETLLSCLNRKPYS